MVGHQKLSCTRQREHNCDGNTLGPNVGAYIGNRLLGDSMCRRSSPNRSSEKSPPFPRVARPVASLPLVPRVPKSGPRNSSEIEGCPTFSWGKVRPGSTESGPNSEAACVLGCARRVHRALAARGRDAIWEAVAYSGEACAAPRRLQQSGAGCLLLRSVRPGTRR